MLFLIIYLCCVSVAQLDRASGYGPEGREFESCHLHRKSFVVRRSFFCALKLRPNSRSFALFACLYFASGTGLFEARFLSLLRNDTLKNNGYEWQPGVWKRGAALSDAPLSISFQPLLFYPMPSPDQSLSTIAAQPIPPPTQSVARPFLASLFSIS